MELTMASARREDLAGVGTELTLQHAGRSSSFSSSSRMDATMSPSRPAPV
jgi:hypothetical protein